MSVRAYGLFWRVDEVNWTPGHGRRCQLLGRRGSNQPALRIADFWTQRGVYILYGNLGPYYAGLTRDQNLGKRLKDHLTDVHANQWDRFSWFGFRSVLIGKDERGLLRLKNLASATMGAPEAGIKDLEALLIKSMALQNRNDSNFTAAEPWMQVQLDEAEKYMLRFGCPT